MRLDNRFLTYIATIAVFILIAAAWPLHPVQAAEGKITLLEAPEPLPQEAVYYDAEGAAHSVSALQGKVVILHFWATWCPPCIVELPEMQKTLAGITDKDLLLVPVSLDFKAESVTAFYDKTGLDYPVWLDKKSALLRSLNIKGLPGTVILNRKGEIIARYAGVVDWASPQTTALLTKALKD